METAHRDRREGSRHDGRRGGASGNENERLEIVSGGVVFIDQYILANPLLRGKRISPDLISKFGAVLVDLEPGTYSVFRNPYDQQMLICPLGSAGEDFYVEPNNFTQVGLVPVDTRCLLVFDEELLDDGELMRSYADSWVQGLDGQKTSRDMIRENGGAVRYGFSRQFEELVIGKDKSGERLGIWSATPPAAPKDENEWEQNDGNSQKADQPF